MRPVAAAYGMTWSLHRPGPDRRGSPSSSSRQGHCLADLLARVDLGELDATIAFVASNHDDHEGLVERHGVDFHLLPGRSRRPRRPVRRHARPGRGQRRRPRRARPLHAGPAGRVRRRLPEPDHQHPPLVPPGLRGRQAVPPGLRAGREAHRRHRALRHHRARRGPDHPPGRHRRSATATRSPTSCGSAPTSSAPCSPVPFGCTSSTGS